MSDLTNFAKKAQQKRKRALDEKRKSPDFKKKYKTKCGKCGSIRSVVIKKIPYTEARRERGETHSWSGTCKKCGHYWTQDFDY